MKTEQLHLIQRQQEAVEQETTLKQEHDAIQQQFSLLLTPTQTQSDRNSLQQFVQIVSSLDMMLQEYKNNLVMIKGLKIKEKML